MLDRVSRKTLESMIKSMGPGRLAIVPIFDVEHGFGVVYLSNGVW